jgi:hypothetical protein
MLFALVCVWEGGMLLVQQHTWGAFSAFFVALLFDSFLNAL